MSCSPKQDLIRPISCQPPIPHDIKAGFLFSGNLFLQRMVLYNIKIRDVLTKQKRGQVYEF